MKITAEEKKQSLEALHEIIKPGDKIQTILRHVSRSVMQREISVVFNGQLLDWHVSRVLDMRRGKHDGLVIGGCGMDMGFEIVYQLGRCLFKDGFAPSDIAIRPDNKIVNVNIGRGTNEPMTKSEILSIAKKGWKFTRGRNGDTSGWDNDGGYALEQEWL